MIFAIVHYLRSAESWLALDATERPIVNLASPRHSPVVATIDEYMDMFMVLPAEALPLLVGPSLICHEDLKKNTLLVKS